MADYPISPKDYWRAIILFGLNTATYKLALAQCVMGYVSQSQTNIPMNELAKDFFETYLSRLENGKPQLILPHRLTVMERIIQQFRIDKLTREQAIARVQNEAFSDVIPRFHTVDQQPVPIKFYEHNQFGLLIRDEAFEVLSSPESPILQQDILSRWDLLEAAFEIRRTNQALENDIRQFYLSRGYERTDITFLRPVLDGYQNERCFYCGESMKEEAIAVDHVIPRQVVYHDEVWNLVLAHEFCNAQKSDLLPTQAQIEQLNYRNEFFIKSNHPLKDKIIQSLGATPNQRAEKVNEIYNHAKLLIGYTWEGIRNYNPRTDPLYHFFVRK